MPRIRCHYPDCVFLDDSYCSAAQVEFDPDAGCSTYSPNEEATDENWEDKELADWEEEVDDEEDEMWLEEEEDEF